MASAKKKTKKTPRRRKAAPAVLAPSEAAAGPSKTPLLVVGALVAAAVVVSLLFKAPSRPSGPGTPPARSTAPDELSGVPTAVPASKPSLPPQKRGDSPMAAAVWDRSQQKKQPEFRIVRPEGGSAEVRIFKKGKRSLRYLVSPAGKSETVSIYWDGKDESGKAVPAGTYYVRLSGAHGDSVEEILVK